MLFEETFTKFFQEDYLKNHYINNIENSAKPGIDRINTKSFNRNQRKYFEQISKKILEGTFNFTPYKECLISKGRNKRPRIISLASIKDKIVLSLMKDLLNLEYGEILKKEFIKKKVMSVNEVYKNDSFSHYIKMDMENFYGSLEHDFLLSSLKLRINSSVFLELIKNSIEQRTIAQGENKKSVPRNSKGVPQGLPISNILADIYMLKFDEQHMKADKYKYFRYVDDILIFCAEKDKDCLYDSITTNLNNDLKLKPHEINKQNPTKSKTVVGKVNDGFSYLGYEFYNKCITVRKSSLEKIEKSLERIYVEHSNDKISYDVFIWKLNCKITGGINEGVMHGWVSYYSQITDLRVISHLDRLISKFNKRFNMEEELARNKGKIKRFKRTFYEVTRNPLKSSYIPNFDSASEKEMKELLDKFKIKYDDTDYVIKYKKLIKNNMQELEKDVNDGSGERF